VTDAVSYGGLKTDIAALSRRMPYDHVTNSRRDGATARDGAARAIEP